jgi:chromosome partitioning protein
MKVLSIAGSKGGTGKTTLATSLAVEAQATGRRVLILDLDPQGAAAEWGDARGREPAVKAAQAPRLPRLLADASAEGFDLAVIDCPPQADAATLAACKAADLVLIPCRPAARDLSAVASTFHLAVDVARRPATIVLNACPPNSGVADAAVAALMKGGAPLCPIRLGDRAAHVTHQSAGLVAAECDPRGRAAAEIRALAAWVDAEIGG